LLDYRKDIIYLPKNFPFDIFDAIGAKDKNMLHFHDCLEINYVESGSGINIIENKEFKMEKGDFFIINNLEHHYGFSNGDLVMKVIIFNPELVLATPDFDYNYVSSFYNRNYHFSNKIDRKDAVCSKLIDILYEIEEEWNNQDESSKMMVKALLLKMLALFHRYFKVNKEIGTDIKAFYREYERLRPMLTYISDNLDKSYSLQELADMCKMSRTYFSEYFKKVMKVNVTDYIQSMRLNKACRMLNTGNDSIIDISLSCGFSNVTHFNRVFKKHLDTTPSKYRIR